LKRLKGYEEYIETVVGGKIVRYFRGWGGLAAATITIHNNGWVTLRIYCARQMIVKLYSSYWKAWNRWKRFCTKL